MAGFVAVCDAAEIPAGGAHRVVVEGNEIALFNVSGEIFATADVCTHDEASLADGELFGHVVECPLHGARFDVRSGKALSLPAVYPVKTYPVRLSDGRVEVEL